MNKLLSKEITFGKSKGKIPSKRTMNLYVKKKDGNSWQVVLPLAVFLIAVTALIYQFGVVGRLKRLSDLEAENAQMYQTVQAMEEKLKEYGSVTENYRLYSKGYLRQEEAGLVKRKRIFDMLHESVAGIGSIRSESIEENQIGMVVDISTLEDMDLIQDRLKDMANIDEIKISTARGVNQVSVEGTIVFTVKKDSAADASAETPMSDTEKDARIRTYTEEAEQARRAKEQAAAPTAAVTSSQSSKKNSQAAKQSTQAAAPAPTAAAPAAAAPAPTEAAPAQQAQNIGGDSVVLGGAPPAGMGFDAAGVN